MILDTLDGSPGSSIIGDLYATITSPCDSISLRRKIDTAYVAFYWYTYYTEDLGKDCFEFSTTNNSIIIDNVVHTENGSVVQLNDGRKVFVANNMVKSGDYVNVDGVKYRVK